MSLPLLAPITQPSVRPLATPIHLVEFGFAPPPISMTHLEAAGGKLDPLPVPTPSPTPQVVYTAPPASSHDDWMAAAGIPASDFGYMDYIVSHESTWQITAQNPSGAYGLCQSLPASKMSSAGSDYLTNPITQLKWCYNYGVTRYGSLSNAASVWSNQHWW
jgi:hypothetical protein